MHMDIAHDPVPSSGGGQRATASGLVVRPVADEDADALRALVGGVFAEYPGCVLDPEGLDADLAAWATHLDERGGSGWVVVDPDAGGAVDDVVACVGVAPATDAVPGLDIAAVELKRLYVAARARRQGLGRALVARVEAWARAHGAGAVLLWSDTRFADAHRLYERCGYRRTGRARQLHDPSDTTEDEFVHVLGEP